MEESDRWTPKRAFRRTLESKEDRKKKKKSRSKSPKKKRESRNGQNTVINNVNNITSISIVNNITTTTTTSSSHPMGMSHNSPHHPMSSASDPKNNVIVIEDSPSRSVGALSGDGNGNGAGSGTLSLPSIGGGQSTFSEVIDLCGSDNESKDTKKSRKRKHPSLEVEGNVDGHDVPTKKRKITDAQ